MLADEIRNEMAQAKQTQTDAQKAINKKIKIADALVKDVDFTNLLSLVLTHRKEDLMAGTCKLSRKHDEVFRSFVWVESGHKSSDFDYEIQKCFKDVLEHLGEHSQQVLGSNFKYSRTYGSRVFTLLDCYVLTKITESTKALGFNLEITDDAYIISL